MLSLPLYFRKIKLEKNTDPGSNFSFASLHISKRREQYGLNWATDVSVYAPPFRNGRSALEGGGPFRLDQGSPEFF